MTRYPPGLISALEKLQADTSVVRSGSRATAHMWIEDPMAQRPEQGEPGQAEPDVQHPHRPSPTASPPSGSCDRAPAPDRRVGARTAVDAVDAHPVETVGSI